MQTEETLVAAATGGDEQAFALLTERHRRALHLHCYRMLGSLDDADDAVQETMLRAWRGLDRFEPRAPLVAWLHTIATNVCLTALGNRRRRDLLHLQPYPDLLLERLEAPAPGPDARLALRESVERAREENPVGHTLRDPERERALLARFMAAWDAIDIDGLVELLTADALMTMPPVPMRVEGAAAIGAFFATVPAEGRLDEFSFVHTRANRQPALAAYIRGRTYGLMVFSLADEHVTGIVGFSNPTRSEPFGLPST